MHVDLCVCASPLCVWLYVPYLISCDWNWYWCLFCFCCHIQHTMFGGSVWLYEAVLLVFALYLWSYLLLMYYVLYRVLSYWYPLCSRKANFYVIHRQNFCILYSNFLIFHIKCGFLFHPTHFVLFHLFLCWLVCSFFSLSLVFTGLLPFLSYSYVVVFLLLFFSFSSAAASCFTALLPDV